MKKNILRILVGVIAMAFVLEMPSAYAIFGIRAARTVIAARRVGQKTSSSSDADKAYAEEKARFNPPAGHKNGAERVPESDADPISDNTK